jgi:hypothetical protein
MTKNHLFSIVAFLLGGMFPAQADLCRSDRTIAATSAASITRADIDSCIFVDSRQPVTLTLEAPSSVGVGSVTIKKVGRESNPVVLSGAFELGQTTLYIPLETESVTLRSDGSATWHVIATGGLDLMRSPYYKSEHTITGNNAVNPQDGGYLYLVDLCEAARSIMVTLPDINAVAFAHQNFTVSFLRVDRCTQHVASIVAHDPAQPIMWNHAGSASPPNECASGGWCKVDLTAQYQGFSIYTPGTAWYVYPSQGY